MSDTLARLTASLSDRYRVTRELGAGGMATVYLAHDLKHERDVAIKVLHPDLGAALGGERFLSEIRTTARLQHPHILPLLDSGEADGLLYYVMPLVTGETLRARMEREKQLPIADAVRIAREVASALDYAHRQNVIHRDIKPENILLQDGSAVVADFGIALAVQSAGGQRMTQTGLSLGTPQYMSPEQATGERTIDARSDVYALAAVTYEMLAGEPPFTGPTVQAIVARLMSEAPRALVTQRPAVPPHVEAAVLQALEKIPADRFASAAEFAEAMRGGTGARLAATTAVRHRGTSRALGLAAVLGVICVAVGFGAALLWRRTAEAPTSRQQVVLWQHTIVSSAQLNAYRTQLAMALDGSMLVFADSLDGQWKLYRKARDAERAQLIPGTENGVSPFLSADGQTLGFFTMDGALKKISLSGGAPITLVAQIEGVNRLAVWLDDATIMYLTNINTGVRIDADGREIRRYQFGEARTTTSVQGLVPLPGSRGLLAYGCQNNCSFRTYGAVMDLESGKKTELLTNLVAVEYSSTGHLLAIESNRRVTATPFDAATLTTTGASVTVLDGPVTKLYGVSTSGQLLYQVDPQADQAEQLHWVDRTGRVLSADSSWKAPLVSPAISSDGRVIAVSTNAGNTAGKTVDLWLRTADAPAQPVRGARGSQWRPSWFNSGNSLAFVNRPSDSSATWRIMRAEGDGSAARSWLQAPLGVWEVEIAANNAWMVYRTNEPDDRYGVYVRRVDGDTTPRRILADLSQPMVFSLSPDGRWLAYVSDEGGAREVYVTSIPDGTTRRQVSRGGGEEPRFSRSGTALFFVSGGALTVVPVLPGPSFEVGAPRVLFPVEGYARAANRQQYDVASGDDRFLMIKQPPAPSVPPVVMAEHWFTELRAKLAGAVR